MTGPDDDQFPPTPPGIAPGSVTAAQAKPADRAGSTSNLWRLAVEWGPVLAWMAVIFVLSAQPGLRVSDDPSVDLPIRHFAHVVVYGVLAVLLLRVLGGGAAGASTWRSALAAPVTWTWRSAVLAVAIAGLYGVTDEVHQTYVPDRTGHLVDVGWDLLGAGIAVLLLRFVPWRRLRRQSVSVRPD